MTPLISSGASVSALRVAVLCAVTILQAGALTVLAQQTMTSATLAGRVEDANGATLPGAVVIATNTETEQSRTATTDAEGRYRFSYLPVGDYELKVERQGFATLTRQLTLTVGQALEVPLQLPVAGVAESVRVSSAGAAAVEAGGEQVAEA